MVAWAVAGLFVVSILWEPGTEARPQIFEGKLEESGASDPSDLMTVLLEGELQNGPAYDQKGLRYYANADTTSNTLERAFPIFTKFERDFKKHAEEVKGAKSEREASDRSDAALPKPYEDHSASQSTYQLGPHQIETIQSDHFHQKVPPFDVSGYQHHSTGEKHGEVHYHQHTHVHKHEHKQDHVHQHKQAHQHKHVHSQQHKHEHQSEHKHGHEHKHDHHQQHKHDHHHDHKHSGHHDHKHQHQHGHKHQAHHQHHGQHKHNHGHKHQAKHEHKHKHLKHHH